MKNSFEITFFLSERRKKKILIRMKLLAMMMLVGVLQLSASVKGQVAGVNMSLQDASLVEFFTEIKIQTDYEFLYNHDLVMSKENVSIEVDQQDLTELLENVLHERGLGYQLDDGVIIISERKYVVPEVQQEKKQINGKVTDEKGQALVGVSVYVKGTQVGTSTNIDGVYDLEIPGDAQVLVFSFVGMETREVEIGEQVNINAILVPTHGGLNEVVVMGYGNQKREQIGSAVSLVKAEEIEMKAIGKVNFEEALAGQIKGVNIMKENGRPGARSVINIRGYTTHDLTNAASAPLFVIDGVQMFVFSDEMNIDNPLDAIDPFDIESITVLKDAGATAIYGSNGANGVIIVKTKGGKKNTKINATANFTYSFNSPTVMLDPLNAEDFKAYQIMAAKNTLWKYEQGFVSTGYWRQAVTIIDPETGNVRNTIHDNISGKDIPLFGNADTDWTKEVYKSYSTSKVMNINVNGGSEKTTYSLTASYNDSEPLTFESYYKKYGLSLRIDSDVNDWLKIGTNANISGSTDYSQSYAEGSHETNQEMITFRSDQPVYNEDGSFYYEPSLDQAWGGNPGEVNITAERSNPVAQNTNQDHSRTKNIISNIYAEAKLFKGFSLRADANVYSSTGKRDVLISAERGHKSNGEYFFTDDLTKQFVENLNTTFDLRGSYHAEINDHSIDAMLGASWFRSHYTSFSQKYVAVKDPYVLNNASSAENTTTTIDSKKENAMNSFYSRVQYSYKGKYTATLNFRSDKSSKFGPGNKIAYFPAVAFNWNIAAEDFMNKIDFINRLSLRTSYGKSGSTNVPEFTYLQVFNAPTSPYIRGYGELGSLLHASSTFPNQAIGWESTRELNTGLDFSLFNNRIYGSLDIYSKQTSGVLGPAPYRLDSGAGSFTANLADIDNKGWEFEIGADLIRSKDMYWSLDFNIAKNSAIRGAYHGMMSPEIQGVAYLIGEPLTSIIGYRVEGIIQTKDEMDALNAASPTGRYWKSNTGPGDFKYRDLNDDGMITSDDQEIIGDRAPDFFGGFNTMFRYKNISLQASFQYVIGMGLEDRTSSSKYSGTYIMSNTAFPGVLTETWRPDNTTANIPMKVFGNRNSYTSDATLQNDVYFIKVNTMRINYEMPERLMSKSPFKSAMVYLALSNPFIFTNYKGMDPTTAGGEFKGQAYYPTTRSIALGLRIGL